MKTLILFLATVMSIATAVDVAYGEVNLYACIDRNEKYARLIPEDEECDLKEVREVWILPTANQLSIGGDLVFKIGSNGSDILTCTVMTEDGDRVPSRRILHRAQYECPGGHALNSLVMEENLIGASCIQLSNNEINKPESLITICEILWE